MSSRTLEEQLTKYLADAHSIEVQALAQLERAPAIASEHSLADAFRAHLEETREHERLVRELLEQRNGDRSTIKDLAGRIGGWAMVVFARLNPDTPGKLTAHAFSYEHMELAAYELLSRVAARAGEQSVVDTADRIAGQEKAMAERLRHGFDSAVSASLGEKDASDPRSELVAYLQDAHAIETQAVQLLESAPALVGGSGLAAAFRDHLSETREHRRMIEGRLRAYDARPQRFQDTAMRIGGLSVGAFFRVQPDTDLKLAGFAFAFEHLEIAAYELLRGVAVRARDEHSASVAEQIVSQERAAADRIAACFDEAVDTSLAAIGTTRATA
jgi:ferritin-like metal-binding protein YciE